MPDINIGQISEALNDKMDRDGNNIESPKLPVFLVAKQDPTAQNNYTWYRKYSDGWVEQGGITSVTATGNSSEYVISISLPVEMADNKYTGWCQATFGGGSGWNGPGINPNSTTTVAKFSGWVSGSSTVYAKAWEVKGMAAS